MPLFQAANKEFLPLFMDNAPGSESPVDFKGLLVLLILGLVTLFSYMGEQSLLFLLCGAAFISIVIWQTCDPFAEVAQWVGKKFHIPGSVRGATLDAVASSMPELYSGIFFVIVALQVLGTGLSGEEALHSAEAAGAEGYGSAVATCAGSAIYNMILIPACVALVVSFRRPSHPTVEVGREVMRRDAMWFLFCEIVLIFFLFQDAMHWWMAVVLLGLYGVYVSTLWAHARRHRRELLSKRQSLEGDEEFDFEDLPTETRAVFGIFRLPINNVSAWLILIACTALAATACYFLVEVTHLTAELLDVPTFFVALVLAAAVSSVPDTFLSIGAGMRGDDSGAVSNAFGSNIFDICICLSIPLLVNSWLTGWEPVLMTQNGEPMKGIFGLRILLLVLSAITVGIIWHKRQLNRPKAIVLVVLYLVFVAFAVLGSLDIVHL